MALNGCAGGGLRRTAFGTATKSKSNSIRLVILDHAFAKKTQKTPKSEIDLAEQRKREYFRRKMR
jgi:phage-related protein